MNCNTCHQHMRTDRVKLQVIDNQCYLDKTCICYNCLTLMCEQQPVSLEDMNKIMLDGYKVWEQQEYYRVYSPKYNNRKKYKIGGEV